MKTVMIIIHVLSILMNLSAKDWIAAGWVTTSLFWMMASYEYEGKLKGHRT